MAGAHWSLSASVLASASVREPSEMRPRCLPVQTAAEQATSARILSPRERQQDGVPVEGLYAGQALMPPTVMMDVAG